MIFPSFVAQQGAKINKKVQFREAARLASERQANKKPLILAFKVSIVQPLFSIFITRVKIPEFKIRNFDSLISKTVRKVSE